MLVRWGSPVAAETLAAAGLPACICLANRVGFKRQLTQVPQSSQLQPIIEKCKVGLPEARYSGPDRRHTHVIGL